jgi:hypothetical protein
MARPHFRESLVQPEDRQAHLFSGQLVCIKEVLESLVCFVWHSKIPEHGCACHFPKGPPYYGSSLATETRKARFPIEQLYDKQEWAVESSVICACSVRHPAGDGTAARERLN